MVFGGDIYLYQSIWKHCFTTCSPILCPQQINGQRNNLTNSRGRRIKQRPKREEEGHLTYISITVWCFALHEFGHACKEAEIIKSLKLATLQGRQYDPNDTAKNYTTMVKVKSFTHEGDAFDDLFL